MVSRANHSKIDVVGQERERVRNRILAVATKEFATKELEPRAAEIDEKGEFPHDTIKKMAELGLLSMTIPEKYGGAAFDFLSLAIAVEEISRGYGRSVMIEQYNMARFASFAWSTLGLLLRDDVEPEGFYAQLLLFTGVLVLAALAWVGWGSWRRRPPRGRSSGIRGGPGCRSSRSGRRRPPGGPQSAPGR